jgi:phospholipid:diacylglycerol acyltransferase
MKWVESPAGGNGGHDWVERHIDSFVSIAGPMLGVAKTISSLLSGEQRDTVQGLAAYVIERFLSKTETASMFRSWGGLLSLLPKGGSRVWGTREFSPDDPVGTSASHGNLLMVRGGEESLGHNQTLDDVMMLLGSWTDEHFQRRMTADYSFGLATSLHDMEPDNPRSWTNTLELQLPRAPSMKIYCLYGVGKETERAYFYTPNANVPLDSEIADLNVPRFVIDSTVNDPSINLIGGVRISDG